MTETKGKRLPPPADFDDNPEWTDEMVARARPATVVHGPDRVAAMQRKRGRPAKEASERKQPVSIRLSPEVIAALRTTGEGWQTRVDELLKAALEVRLEGIRSPNDPAVIDVVVAALHLGDPRLDLPIANDELDHRSIAKRILSALGGPDSAARDRVKFRDARTGTLSEAHETKSDRKRV